MITILVNPPIRLPRTFAHYPMFSTLGLLTNAAWLREQGQAVQLVDAFSLTPRLNLRDDGDGFRHVGAEVDELVRAVQARAEGERAAVIVAVTMFSDLNRPGETLIPKVTAALRAALPPSTTIGLADLYTCGMNYFPYDVPGTLSRLSAVDWVLVGEGEPTLPELITRLEAGRPLADLPRLASRPAAGALSYNEAAPTPLADLDALPLPAFDLLEMESYFSAQADAIRADLVHEYHGVERQLPLMTSRSCPYRCRFCTNQVLSLPWRAHSVGWLRRAVAVLRERYHLDRVLFLDDNINIDQERFRELVAMLADQRLPWDAVNGFRADRLDGEMVRAIKAAGNTKITVSAESGDPETLRKVIKKGLKLRSVIDLAARCREERLPLQVHYILGVPGETRAQMNRTLEFATELFEREGAWPLLQHAIPFPGTQVYRDCEERGLFVAPPETLSGAVLEERSIIRTPEFEPEEVVAMKEAAQHLHAAQQALTYLEVEARCDSECLACHCSDRQRDDAPSREELRAQLSWARFLGGQELILGGGEPTLRRDLAEIVREGRGAGYRRVRLVTNGHGLSSRARLAALLEAGLTGLIVDLFGASEAVHDAVAGEKGAFRLTLAGLRQAGRLGCEDVEALAPIARTNLLGLPALSVLAHRLGLKALHLRLPPPDSLAARRGLIPPWPEAAATLRRALDAVPRGFVQIQGAPLCLTLPDGAGALTPSPPWVLRRLRPQRAKHPRCRECVMLILCGGFFRPEHHRLYGVDEPPGLPRR